MAWKWRRSVNHIPFTWAWSSFSKEDLSHAFLCLPHVTYLCPVPPPPRPNFLQSCLARPRGSLPFIPSSDPWFRVFERDLSLLRRKGDFRAHTVGRPEMTDTRNSDALKMVTAPYLYSWYAGFFESAGKCVCLALTIPLLPAERHISSWF